MDQSKQNINVTATEAVFPRLNRAKHGDTDDVMGTKGRTASSRKTIATPPEIAQKYRLVRELGSGTQGHVYEAVRLEDGMKVAVKQLRIDSVQTWKTYDLFRREADTLRTLQCKGVARFYEAMEFLSLPQPTAYIVQEFIDGRSIGAMMRSGYRFSIQVVFELAARLVTLLKTLHSHNPPVIHRDIKPTNVLFVPHRDNDDFDLYLIDFGAVANPHLEAGGSTVAGTFGYMPPEQLMGKAVPGSDIYALGAMIAYMLSGVEPSEMQVSDFRLIIDPHLETVPQPVVVLLRQMLDPTLANRLCDYDAIIERFEAFAKNRFADYADRTSGIDQKSYIESLKDVGQYGQAGNIDLWAQLSDGVPRQIPEIYTKLNTGAMVALDSFNEKIAAFMTGDAYKRLKGMLALGVLVAAMAILYFHTIIVKAIVTILTADNLLEVSTMILGLMRAARGNEGLVGIGIIVVIVGIQIVLLYALFVVMRIIVESIKSMRDYRKLSETSMSQLEQYRQHCHDKKDIFQRVLKLGRKSVATVVDVSYMSVDESLCELFYFTHAEIANREGDTKTYVHKLTDRTGYYCHQYASFKIRYAFNPPDDSSSEALIHEVVTFSDCEETLHAGDVISILYYIDPHNNRDVYSIPYPVPYQDLVRFNGLLGHSVDFA